MSDLLNLTGLAKRAGRLALGEDMVEEAMLDHKARLILLACDAADNTVRRIRNRAGERTPVLRIEADRAALGGALGRESCAVCAILDMGFASKIADTAAAENPKFAAIAEEMGRKQAKMVRRKKEKLRKKKA